MTDTKLLNLIRREQYPWDTRRAWPYKAWLAAVRDVKDQRAG